MIELAHRSLKVLVFIAAAWVALWVVQNAGCSKIEDREMEPDMKMDDFKILLSQKRSPGEVGRGDLVSLEYAWPDRKSRGQEKTTLMGRVLGIPGDLLWVERRMISPQIPNEGLVARIDRPPKDEEERFMPVVVPRDTYFVACRNQKDFSVYDSRGVGPFGIWAVRGKVRN